MFHEIILSVIAFLLLAFVLAAVASRNKLILPGIPDAVDGTDATHGTNRTDGTRPRPFAWLAGLWRHVAEWKLSYLLIPAAVLLVIGAARLVFTLMGRRSVEDADALVGMGFQFVAVALSMAATYFFMNDIVGWHDSETTTLDGWKAVVFRSVRVAAALVVFSVILGKAFH